MAINRMSTRVGPRAFVHARLPTLSLSFTHTSVVKALWNALRGRHKYGAMNGNQYAARHCSMITRLTRDSLTWVRVRRGAAIFAHYTSNSFIKFLSSVVPGAVSLVSAALHDQARGDLPLVARGQCVSTAPRSCSSRRASRYAYVLYLHMCNLCRASREAEFILTRQVSVLYNGAQRVWESQRGFFHSDWWNCILQCFRKYYKLQHISVFLSHLLFAVNFFTLQISFSRIHALNLKFASKWVETRSNKKYLPVSKIVCKSFAFYF